ncbi:MAG TPA: hypothetical protein VHA82_16300 [Ramlibacter sp.]|uniref:hypothetical protein n=1 Tax=Ramlibacter sp. TaxID=1917967 RepID=UPI002B692BA8|nr:hypothetical protein [Ramlibacter sp.]HVZ45374.1 hypothetical protein [Ramlibacter sp.]
MSNSPTVADPEAWHRFFGSQANNRAWELAELPGRNEAQTREMVDAAHTAAWHWGHVGTELHRMRAAMLLAQAHALAGDGPGAIAYAREMSEFFLSRPETPDWEIAFTHAIHAHAAKVAGLEAEHKRSYGLAASSVEGIEDPEDKAIVLRTFRHVPAP